MNFHQVVKYIEYLIFSRHARGHGVHSPFIFGIVSKVFRNKSRPEFVLRIESIRRKLLHNSSIIRINDLGAGAGKLKNERRVSDIARYSAIPEKYGNLLSGMSSLFGGRCVIELGTSLGISTMYLAHGSPGTTVYTIEGCNECSSIAAVGFAETGLSNIVQFTGSFDEVLPSLLENGIVPDLVFIDGNHRKEPLLKYFYLLVASAGEESVFILDDIHSSAEMTEAWEEIKCFESVTATIDIYRLGIVFFRKNITRNNYIIRY